MLNKRGAISILQILILILGIVSISYALGSEIKFIKGAEESIFTFEETLPGVEETIKKGLSGTAVPTKATPGVLSSITGFNEGAAAGLDASQVNILAQGGFIDGIVSGAAWGVIAYTAVSMIGSLFGLDSATTNAAATAAGFGAFVGTTVYNIWGAGGVAGTALSGLAATGIGIVVAAIVFVLMYKDTETEIVEFTCEPWDSTTGGRYCEKCNEGILPCSEYQCRSLGQACQLVNPNTAEAKCVWVNQNDVNPPIMQSWDGALLDDYVYKPDAAISPPDRGVIVWNNEEATGCVDAYTPLSFGLNLDEPAKCRLDYLRKDSFEDMDFFFGGSSLLRYNHSQIMSLPGPNSEGNLTLENDGNFAIYTRCQDANGNANTANFVFKFCVNPDPDTTAPLIVSTNFLDGMPIAYGQTELGLELYVNEPAECKWSHLDKDYNDMENELSCSVNAHEMNAQMLYTCTTTLDGLKDNFKNNFYFRCRDQPLKPLEERNTNAESFEFTVQGTKPLVISDVGPNETIKDGTDAVQVTLTAETSAGWDDGRALCYYSETGEEEDYILFYSTDSYEHYQDLWLPASDYEYYIKCVDLGGNSDVTTTSFTVETDTTEPLAVRAYHEGNYLKIITNEDATCVYDTVDCTYNIEDGISMTSKDNTHVTKWNTEINFYIKCVDEYGNEPAPDRCSIIARPFGL